MTGHGTYGGRLTEDEYLCPPCFDGAHECADLFNLEPFGLLACSCPRCRSLQTAQESRETWVSARVDRYFDAHSSGYATDEQYRRWTDLAEREWAKRHPAMAAQLTDTTIERIPTP